MGKLTFQTKSIPTYRNLVTSATATANAHYARVIADGGVIDSYSALLDAITELYTIFTYNLPLYLAAAIDPAIFGYKIGTGSGSTLNGRAAQKLYSLMGASSDVVQNTVAAQPLLLRWNSTDGNYLFLPTASGNNIQTPNAAINQITGDIDISYNCTKFGTIIVGFGKESTVAADGAYLSFIQSNSMVAFQYSNGASFISRNSTVVRSKEYVRAVRIAATGDITFYHSDDGTTWEQIGAVVASPAGNINVGNKALSININLSVNPAQPFLTSNFEVWNGVRDSGGTLAAKFDASDYDISVSQNTVTSSASGEIWTLNRSTATTAIKAALIDRTQIQGDAIAMVLNNATFALAQPNTAYMVASEFAWAASRKLVGGGTTIPLYQRTATPNLSASAGTDIDYASEALNSVKHYMAQFDGLSSLVGTNGVYTVAADAGAGAYDRLDILGGNAANYANGQVNTVVIAKQADSLATRNLMNTLVRSWSNNPA